jgi:Fe-S cluster assembly protein SufD
VTATRTSLFQIPNGGQPLGSSAFLERRKSAAQRADEAGLPSFEEEIWRYTPIADLDVSKYELGAPGGSLLEFGLTNGVDEEAAAVIHIVDGQVVSISVHDESVTVLTDGTEFENLIGSVMRTGADVFSDYNFAYCSAPIVIHIASNAVIAGTVLIRQHTTTEGLAWFPRVLVDVGENSEATVVEHQTSPDIDALVCPVTELRVNQAARLRYLTVQEHGPRTWQIATQMAEIDRDAHLAVSQIALGGEYARARIDTKMVGQGSSADISAVYFGRADAQHDFRTFQRHNAPHTNSNLLFKGVLDDRSRAIYTGLIRIERDAADVNAYQTNRTLKLSEEAWSESVPNLEIENNDVRCSHASAVGPIDRDQRFYLESRGVPEDIAEALIVRGFFADVLDQLPVAAISDAANTRISELLALEGQGRQR